MKKVFLQKHIFTIINTLNLQACSLPNRTKTKNKTQVKSFISDYVAQWWPQASDGPTLKLRSVGTTGVHTTPSCSCARDQNKTSSIHARPAFLTVESCPKPINSSILVFYFLKFYILCVWVGLLFRSVVFNVCASHECLVPV